MIWKKLVAKNMPENHLDETAPLEQGASTANEAFAGEVSADEAADAASANATAPAADNVNDACAQPSKPARKHFTVRAVTTPVAPNAPTSAPAPASSHASVERKHAETNGAAPCETAPKNDPFIRAACEDDDGYDPYSDRPAASEPLFEENPWD